MTADVVTETRYLVPFNDAHNITIGTSHGDITLNCSCGAVRQMPDGMHVSELITELGMHVGRPGEGVEMTVTIEHAP